MKKSLGAKTLVYPTPVWVVGSYDSSGKPNVVTVAWGGICSSRPPCVAISLRKATYSFECIVHHRAFTVNVPSADQVKQADFFGVVSGRQVDKLAEVRWTAVRSTVVDAPYIQECPMVLECKLVHMFELGLHTQFIGEIVDVKAEEATLGADGLPELERVRPILFAPERFAYFGAGDYLGQAFDRPKQA
jgi:flavin reductase (DIM6/NTAB) family NADH-FMN oxidoreductase RutF